jgi:cold-inducible RNA-binding protein
MYRQEYVMAKKLYVGNFSYEATEAQLRELFAQVGEITEFNMIMDRDTGRPKGFAFIQMATDEATQAAIKRFNGHTLGNRALTVNEARPREERSNANSDFGRHNRF